MDGVSFGGSAERTFIADDGTTPSMPVSLDSTVTTAGGVALVSVRVRNTEPVARRVTVANRLPGDVLPPRRHGVPEPGWSADGYDGVVDARDDLALGYACRVAEDGVPADGEPIPRDDTADSDAGGPVELVAVSDPRIGETDPLNAALAELGDHRPPPDAVGPSDDPRKVGGTAADEPAVGGSGPDRSVSGGPSSDPATLPPGGMRYLDGADGRIARAETLAGGSVSDATAVIDAGVGPVGVRELVALDARALGRIAERAESLAARAEAVDVPTSALERLA